VFPLGPRENHGSDIANRLRGRLSPRNRNRDVKVERVARHDGACRGKILCSVASKEALFGSCNPRS
jgi:hypothetical protein